MRKRNSIYALILIVLASKCGIWKDDLPAKITSEIEGKYLHEYPSGEIEILNIRLDSTYEQYVYLSKSNYLNSLKPTYKNQGTWSLDGKKINLSNWLMFGNFGLEFDTLLNKPKHTIFSGATWHIPNDYRKEYKLYFFYENGYIFTKQ